MNATTPSVKRWDAQDSLWLCLAIALHACLLLIPAMQKDHTITRTGPLNITLLSPEPIEKPLVEEAEIKQAALPAIKNKTLAPDDPPEPELTYLEQAEHRADQHPPGEEVILTTARLLDSARKMEWPAPTGDDSRRLGVFVPQPLPENWRSGGGIEDNILNPMILNPIVRPGKTEIVDRWLAADGSHNVIISTPGGQTLCGRALAWDPMWPLVEHVMQFRPCGGGGKRILEMVQRIKHLTSSPL